MNLFLKYKLLNKTRFLVIFIFLLGLFISSFFISGMFEVTVGRSGRIGGAEYRQAMMQEIGNMSYYTHVLLYNSTVVPIFVTAMGIFFFREKAGYFPYQYTRGKSQKKVIINAMLFHALYAAVLFYLAYIIFLTVGYLFIGPNPGDVPRNIFDGIFGTGFSYSHVYLYYLLQGFIQYFLFPLAYVFFACGVALVVKKSYLCVLIPLCYYLGLTIFSMNSQAFMSCWLRYFQPPYTQGFYGYVYNSPTVLTALQPLIALTIPVAASFALIIYYFKRSERVEF